MIRVSMRRLLRLLVYVAFAFALVGGALWLALQPPRPFAPPYPGLTLADVTIVEPGISRRPGQTVTVRTDRIRSLGPLPDGEPVLGADPAYAGAYVLPGLIDMHVHHPPANATLDLHLFSLLFLSHGITTVRDAGTFDGGVFTLRQGISQGRIAGPRIVACGAILDGDPPVWPQSHVIRTPGEARAAVAEVAATGADCVKVYSNLRPELLAAIRAKARDLDLPVIGHVPLWVRLADSGLADVQHLTGVAAPGPTWAWPNPRLDDWLAPVAAGWLSTGPEHLKEMARVSVRHRIAHTPTLVVLARLAELADYERALDDPVVTLLPRWHREVLWNPATGFGLGRSTPATFAALGKALPRAKEAVLLLHRAGVAIHAGSDTMNPFVVPGVSLHEELGHLVDAGLTIEQAWAAATNVAGTSLGVPGLGRIEANAPADFLIFRKDPTIDLDNLSTLEAVVAAGRLYTKEALDREVARYREHFEGAAYDLASTALARVLVGLAPDS